MLAGFAIFALLVACGGDDAKPGGSSCDREKDECADGFFCSTSGKCTMKCETDKQCLSAVGTGWECAQGVCAVCQNPSLCN